MAEEEEVLRLQQQGTLRKHCPQYLFSIDIYLFHNIIDNGVIRYLNIILLNLNCIALKHLTNSVASQCLAEIFRCFYLLAYLRHFSFPRQSLHVSSDCDGPRQQRALALHLEKNNGR